MKVSFSDFKQNIRADLGVRGNNHMVLLLKDPIARFHLYLRLVEFFQYKKAMLLFYILVKFIFLRSSKNLGFSIPPNTLGKGVYLPHWGTIVVNSKAKVGEYSIINVDVVIGRHPSSKYLVPSIGRSVYIAPGVKIFGDVVVSDNCILAANAVVNKSFPARTMVGGIPAKEIGRVSEKLISDYGMFLYKEK